MLHAGRPCFLGYLPRVSVHEDIRRRALREIIEGYPQEGDGFRTSAMPEHYVDHQILNLESPTKHYGHGALLRMFYLGHNLGPDCFQIHAKAFKF